MQIGLDFKMMKAVAIMFVAALSSVAHPQSRAGGMLTRADADDLAIYSMMASNAYANDHEKLYFPLEMLGWRKVDEQGEIVPRDQNSYQPKTLVGRLVSNLQFDIWEDSNSNKTIFAFKGTQERVDWVNGNLMLGISIPYKSAKKHVRDYICDHPDRKVSVTGHSLGGGLALSVSFWEGVDAVVFNTSPRIFDGLEDNKKRANRIAVFQDGDILQKIRKWYPKFLEKVDPEQVIETRFEYSFNDSHRSDLIAQGLLSCSTDSALQRLAKELKLSVSCYLK
ncbi:MAG TPA: hypothetical protein VFY73_18420 [Ideonella sp.]|uniref:lipase family protein n=1 Tax=Ideonella sp. TaxID=1929293 RepID=UPI002E318055|nr:hypothetical protein [Ideonella sp.]HEX5686005.1 hypothetical protein [Ideonella sp.]